MSLLNSKKVRTRFIVEEQDKAHWDLDRNGTPELGPPRRTRERHHHPTRGRSKHQHERAKHSTKAKQDHRKQHRPKGWRVTTTLLLFKNVIWNVPMFSIFVAFWNCSCFLFWSILSMLIFSLFSLLELLIFSMCCMLNMLMLRFCCIQFWTTLEQGGGHYNVWMPLYVFMCES